MSHISVYILLRSFSYVRFVGWGSLGMDILFHTCAHTLVENVMTGVSGKMSESWKLSDDKHFNCKICGRGFSLRGYFFNHRHIHTGEKPFKGNVCGKNFSLNGNLSRRRHTHTGEKS